jgi:hypothetical protein
MKSARNMVITYLIGKKLFLKRMNIKEMNVAKNRMPADALISLSFKTRILYPSTFSPNCIRLFILFVFTIIKPGSIIQDYLIKQSPLMPHQ